MTQLTFRFADSADIPALVALVESAYRGDASRQGWTTEADLLEGQRIDEQLLTADLARENSEVLVGVRDGRIVACAHVRATAPGVGYFGMFAVAPGTQGAGLGKQVIAEAERTMQRLWGVRAVEMTVLAPRTELLAFYERRGYRPTGEHKPFPYGDERFGLPQRDDLSLAVLRKEIASPAQ